MSTFIRLVLGFQPPHLGRIVVFLLMLFIYIKIG